MKRALASLVLVFTMACAFVDGAVVKAEEGLAVGEKAVDAFVEGRIAFCRMSLDLPSEIDRAACAKDAGILLDQVEPSLEAASLALAAYWVARDAKDVEGARKALYALAVAVSKLPPTYFGKAQAALARFL